MYKIWKYYNQNKLKVWAIILAVVLGWLMLQVVNNALKEANEQENTSNEETTSNVVSYSNESKAIISDGSVSSKYSDDLAEIINQFYTYCVEHNPQRAYEMLTDDTKRVLYQTQELFEDLYYNSKFEGNKQFSFQAWSIVNDTYIYQVRIYDNMLTTGQTDDNYIEDFVSIVPDGGSYKLNISSYIGTETINKKEENEILSVEVGTVDKYLDYETYTFRIKNKTDKSILLDTRRKTDTCYVVDQLGNKFEAFLYENNEEDLEFSPQESKTITIRFNDAYRESLEIQTIHFDDIVDLNMYNEDENIEGSAFEIRI